MESNSTPLFTLDQLAERWCCSKRTVWRRVKELEIPVIRFSGSNSRTLIEESAVLAAERHAMGPAGRPPPSHT